MGGRAGGFGAFPHGTRAGSAGGGVAVGRVAVIAGGIAAIAHGRSKGAAGHHVPSLGHLAGDPHVVLDPGPDEGVDPLNRGGVANGAQAEGIPGGVCRGGAGSPTFEAEYPFILPGEAEEGQQLEHIAGADQGVPVGIRVVRPLGRGRDAEGQHQDQQEQGAVGGKRRGHGRKSTGDAVCFHGRNASPHRGHGVGHPRITPAPEGGGWP